MTSQHTEGRVLVQETVNDFFTAKTGVGFKPEPLIWGSDTHIDSEVCQYSHKQIKYNDSVFIDTPIVDITCEFVSLCLQHQLWFHLVSVIDDQLKISSVTHH